MPATPHPWRALRAMPHIDIGWHDLPHPLRAVTNGVSICMDRRLTQRERRSTLAHELEHIRQGHTSCQSEKVERHVRAMAAQWLLRDVRSVADALCFHRGDVDAAADDLWVDEATLWARFDPAHTPPMERAYVARRLEELGDD